MINLSLIIYSLIEPESKEVGWLHKINGVLVLSFYDNGEWKCISNDITEELINAETTSRTLADTALDIRIDAEANTRNSADIALSSALNIESSYRANADVLLNSDIVVEKTRATTVENTIGTSVGLDPETKIYTNTGLYIGKLIVNTVASDIKALDSLIKNLSVIINNKVTIDPNKSLVDNTEIEKLLNLPTWNDTLTVIKNNAPVSHYNYNIKKTYDSVSSMNADKAAPIGTDELPIKIGDIVTVVNSTTPSENGIYSYEGGTDGWKYQSSFNFQVENTRSQNTDTSPSSKMFDDLNVDYDNTQKFLYNHIFKVDHSILLNNGDVSYNEGYSENLVVSDYIPLSLVYGFTIGKLEAWRLAQGNPIAFYDKNKTIIGSAYNPATVDTETSVDITINNTLTDQYPNAYYVRFGGNKSLDLVIKNINNEKRLEIYKKELHNELHNELYTIFKDKNILCNTFLNVEGTEFTTNSQWDNQKSVYLAKDTGILTSGVGAEGYFCVSPFLPIQGISKIHFSGYIYDNTALCVQYDINKGIISVLNATNNTETDVDIDNNAYYIRFCGDCRIGHGIPIIKLIDTTCENYQNKLNLDFYNNIIKTDNFYKINNFDNAIFCGDSVTKGYVVEGTITTQYIYQEMPEKSYPMQFAKMFPKINVTVKAQTGISAIDYLSNIYPTIDYTQYDLVVVELGLNGYLNYNDLNIAGTNTNCYRKIVQGIRQQNKNAIIVLNRSSSYSTYWMPILQYIASESNCIVLDLATRRYLNLNDTIYHGYYQNGSERVIDMAHFTRKGYNAKAYVFSKLLEEQLIDDTLYN